MAPGMLVALDGGGVMVGSAIGRMLAALPGVLASVGAGLVVVGVTNEVSVGLGTVALLLGLVLIRVSTLGMIIDLDRERLLVRSFWRTRAVHIDELERIDARAVGEGWPPGVRFVTTDGREFGTLALCYLDEPQAVQLIGQLEAIADDIVEVDLSPASFRPRPA